MSLWSAFFVTNVLEDGFLLLILLNKVSLPSMF